MKRLCPHCEQYRETRRVRRFETYRLRDVHGYMRELRLRFRRVVCAVCGADCGTDADDERTMRRVYRIVGLEYPPRRAAKGK